MPKFDLFTYRDFDSLDLELAVADNAAEKLGFEFRGLRVVALGPPIHDGTTQPLCWHPRVIPSG